MSSHVDVDRTGPRTRSRPPGDAERPAAEGLERGLRPLS